MKVLISGGGTGGHIFPAIAIGESIVAREPQAELLFVGGSYGMETTLIPKAGHTLVTLPVRGFLGKGLAGKLGLLWRLPVSMFKCVGLVLKHKPKVVIGVGGYASAPLLFTAALMGVPTMVQEQNAVAGLVNRLSSRFAKLGCLGFGEAASGLHCRSIVTGNPVRKNFGSGESWRASRKTLLILGGSQGSVALNRVVPELLCKHLHRKDLVVIHQCGTKSVDAVREAYADAPFQVEVTPFIDDMGAVMNRTLFAICRAGASTIAELKRCGLPALLVPFPHAAHDHQTHNARSLVSLGAAVTVPEAELPEAGALIDDLLHDPERLAAMAQAFPCDPPDSADLCAAVALDLAAKIGVSQIVQNHAHVS